mgnify:CR=1 FL=1
MILFLISLAVIICMHEAAHLLTAKHCKCGVEIFSIGFGPALFKKKLGGTVYQIAPFLLGGFCKLKGELDATEEQDAFVNLPYSKKFSIVIAGCAVNVIFGALIMALGLRLHNSSMVFWVSIYCIRGNKRVSSYTLLRWRICFMVSSPSKNIWY